MSRLRWPDSTNSVSEKPGTIQYMCLKRLRQHQCASAHTKEPGQETESPENRASPDEPDSAWRSVVNHVLWRGLVRSLGRISSDKPAS